jgi:hypothetical protein
MCGLQLLITTKLLLAFRTIAEKIAESQYIQRKLYVLKQNRKQDKRTKKDATMQTL